MTIIEFLTARYDDETEAARAVEPDWDADPGDWFDAHEARGRQLHTSVCGYRVGNGLDKACECGVPARVLADLAAKRAVAEQHNLSHMCPDDDVWTANPDMAVASRGYGGPCLTLRLLAAPYAAHDDFNPAWLVPPTP